MCFLRRPEFLEDFTVAGTIQDYVVSMLCGLDGCVMTPQNAASWGFFNTSSNQWNTDMYVKCRSTKSMKMSYSLCMLGVELKPLSCELVMNCAELFCLTYITRYCVCVCVCML